MLRRLWAWLADDTVGEFKSLARPFRRGDLARLCGYGVQHQTRNIARLRPQQITLLLVVPSMTPTLRDEIAWMNLTLEDLTGGYLRVHGMIYLLYLVLIDEVAAAEQDSFLALFGHRSPEDPRARWWFQRFITHGKEQEMVQKLEGYDRMLKRFLAKLTPEQRLAGIAPRRRLAGLAPEEQILAMSDDVLRTLPEDYLRSLSPAVQRAIRKRTGRPRAPRSEPRASFAR